MCDTENVAMLTSGSICWALVYEILGVALSDNIHWTHMTIADTPWQLGFK